MTDIQHTYEQLYSVKYLVVKYNFRNMPNLVADKYGNFFTLTNCQNKRTSYFKKLVKKNNRIYYNRIPVTMQTLRKRVFINQSKIIIT